ncbi:MAG: serine/threonine-protein phosphatase [Lachnospiraceae bacterium]|nr:serine/threonine-protein phosphatase [Lachnospiraceae bacterium]
MNRKIVYGYVWEAGTVKQINEDSLLLRTVKTKNGSLLMGCICDGMGGVGNGETASGYVMEQLEKWFLQECLPAVKRSKSRIVIKGKGFRFFEKINKKLFEHMRQKALPLGTTASLLILFKGWGYIFHMGDSRIYQFRSCPVLKKAALVRQLTKDHKKDESTLTRCLGLTPDWEPDFCRFRIGKGSCGFLLCSDGFYRRLEQEQIRCLSPKMLKDGRHIERRLKEIAERIKKKGEQDNLSALYIKLEA